jgi:predicted ferric reductase
LLLFILVPVVLWAGMSALGPRFATLTTSLDSVGVALGLAGAASFALNLVLGGRLSFVEDLFGSLDRMYRVHQINGRAAYALLLSHAVMMIASTATTSFSAALHLFVPSTTGAIFLGVIALTAMTVAISLTLFAALEHEVFVWVQRSFGVIFMIALFHLFRVPAASAASRLLTLYLAALSAAGAGAWIYRSVFGNVLVRRHQYVVQNVRRLVDRVTEVTMAPVDVPLRFLPGQFLYVTFQSAGLSRELHPITVSPQRESATLTVRPGDIANQFHPFSITSSPGARELRVAVKAVGDYTYAMRDLAPGDGARIEGPYGGFSYRLVLNRNQVWIAGGIGITPFLSMARDLDQAADYDIDLYYCTKSLEAAAFLEDLEAIASTHPTFRVLSFPEDVRGFITARDVQQTSARIREPDILICGPRQMIEGLTAQFVAAEVPRRRIHFEKFSFIPGGGR